MSSLVQVRNVPDDALGVLKSRAAARNESLNSYMLRLIAKDVERPTVAEVFDRAESRRDRAAVSSVDAIRRGREEHDRGSAAAR